MIKFNSRKFLAQSLFFLAFMGLGSFFSQAQSQADAPHLTDLQTNIPVPQEIRPSMHLKPVPPSAANFSPEEIQEFQRRYGMHASQNPVNQAMTLATDTLGWRDRQALEIIQHFSSEIQATGKEYQLNPLILAAILFDEIRHEKPTEEVMTQWGLAKTLGLAQISQRELIMQGFYDEDLKSLIHSGHFDQPLKDLQGKGKLAATKDLRKLSVEELKVHLLAPQILALLPQERVEIGQKALLSPAENIRILAKQIVRVRKQLGLPTDQGFYRLNNFSELHDLARVVVFHNGRLDYAPKILSYLKLPQLEIALSGCFRPNPTAQIQPLEPAFLDTQEFLVKSLERSATPGFNLIAGIK
ncbi:hypothetical protein COW36_14040 [bacterium (Candidatus Blackallbacteria) CG17_big_fil_post_rev_8_21_14_2_50_48_46]|uniref:Transglycosylase SLT domain-containing protein n=1 Tax=bacterium (Candidatus Blackallbacteria) CG17_big_fil_post_rev_8_21_14_2_50_48_46 TaxID=2014261 RepID=A0A2M7G338_9BACT|nr:MAG: hypothetical protein COW64_23510 [bacterium (Candidatus Blackallbacteria) CG18_big_fil_WC_8_21_14_2_50_49_26]PIW16242.1 MAG: hypothetical protein COW36_14040 [bacterium (Candidatus Blackallbacteria) CG17_big_fil_post_rev_8_21_14_2_50_48_46]PIW49877.1 MAG: hypothetical protein COW20_04265 [bacterium (Candidatus Blackallbacteria) CG13_big_fil_rev_8_21_14_2_50_49_14]